MRFSADGNGVLHNRENSENQIPELCLFDHTLDHLRIFTIYFFTCLAIGKKEKKN